MINTNKSTPHQHCSMPSRDAVSCQLVHHGAAASSFSHTLAWIPKRNNDKELPLSSMVVYSSHGIVNMARPQTVLLANGTARESVWNVDTTLRTSTVGQGKDVKRVISALTHVRPIHPLDSTRNTTCLACGFSDGTVNTWRSMDETDNWKEQVLVEPPSAEKEGRAITDIDGLLLADNRTLIVTCTSDGAFLFSGLQNETKQQRLASFTSSTVRLEPMPTLNVIMILVGTAHPRHNKIHIYTTSIDTEEKSAREAVAVQHCGHLSGHQDWLTSFDWHIATDTTMLASASQDAKIRLWRFTTTATTTSKALIQGGPEPTYLLPTLSDDNASDDLDLSDADDDDDDEGEARLEIIHDSAVTSVSLEALLLGHEEAVTCVKWHPNPMQHYNGYSYILISSSMDRTLLIWGPSTESGGVWTPLTRVGSAGGILGGSVGSSLLGFVSCAVEPNHGHQLLGHAYGGALYFWSLENQDEILEEGATSLDEVASRHRWKAKPCLTGHFEGVSDLCWEAESGEYILTVSLDQTCRLWAAVRTAIGRDVWVELARPQVHGYDLNAIASISTVGHKHLIVSGADEKELRVFDAPLTTIRMLQAVQRGTEPKDDKEKDQNTKRVERAYIPSLGLSNKATSGDGAEEDKGGGDDNTGNSEWGGDQKSTVNLPLERDLGAVSLWPEVRKLFGHNTELFCLASTMSACTGRNWSSTSFSRDVLVASSAKARDVDDASIRTWDVEKGKCVQVLTGGHRSTVAAMSFSPDGRYLASSGKDRRLCLWRRDTSLDSTPVAPPSFSLVSATDAAHKRIIWSVHFCPHDPTILASGSRDGCIKIWKVLESSDTQAEESSVVGVQVKELHSFEPSTKISKKADSVTALAFAPLPIKDGNSEISSAILAVGVESGLIELWRVPLGADSNQSENACCKLQLCLQSGLCHIGTVTKLAWKPIKDTDGKNINEGGHVELVLASVAMDHGCRIFKVLLET